MNNSTSFWEFIEKQPRQRTTLHCNARNKGGWEKAFTANVRKQTQTGAPNNFTQVRSHRRKAPINKHPVWMQQQTNQKRKPLSNIWTKIKSRPTKTNCATNDPNVASKQHFRQTSLLTCAAKTGGWTSPRLVINPAQWPWLKDGRSALQKIITSFITTKSKANKE